MILSINRTYQEIAAGIPNHQDLDKSVLVSEYLNAIEEENEIKKDQYLSAIILRYWYKISGWMNVYNSLPLQYEDYYSVLIDGMMYILGYHPWTDPNNKLSTDPNGVDKAIQRALESQMLTKVQSLNYDCRKANNFNESFEEKYEALGDSYEPVLNSAYNEEYDNPLRGAIEVLINRNWFQEAILCDLIANEDFYNANKICKLISNINMDYITYFITTYDIEEADLLEAIKNLKAKSYYKMNQFINETLGSLAKDKEIINILREF